MSATRLFVVGDYVEDRSDLDTASAGTLYRVIERGRKYLVLRQVSNVSGRLIGVPIGRYVDTDLIPARPQTLAEYGKFVTVEVELTETTRYRQRYTRNELVDVLVEEVPERAGEFGQMSLAELVATLQSELNEHGGVAERVRVDAGCDVDSRDEWEVNAL